MVFLVHRNIGGTDHRNTGDTGDIFPIITGKSRFLVRFSVHIATMLLGSNPGSSAVDLNSVIHTLNQQLWQEQRDIIYSNSNRFYL